MEDKIRAVLGPLERAVLYKYLHNLGYTMNTIDADIERGVREHAES